MSTFWRAVTRFETSKIIPLLALRNALGMVLPLAAGVALGNASAAVIGGIGALNVAYSDGTDPYRYRARRMVVASVLCALAVFTGGLCAHQKVLAVTLAVVYAFLSGLMVAVSTTAADIGIVTLVTLIVFSAHAMAPAVAAQSGALALAGGLLQTALALAFWPVRKYEPERRALAACFAELARAAAEAPEVFEAPPGSEQSTYAQTSLAGLSGDRSVEAERYLALLSQAERIRLALLMLSRFGVRIAREPGGESAAEALAHALSIASGVLTSIAQSLSSRAALLPNAGADQIHQPAESFREAARNTPAQLAPLLLEARLQLESLWGQLRSAQELAGHTEAGGTLAFERREAAQPPRMRLTGALAIVRANLSLESAAMRHALRLAVCVAVGEIVSLAAGWTRAYWCPMTVAIVLKPDFTSTFSRGILRVAGTLIGVVCATALFHVLSPSVWVQVALIGALGFLLRCYGPANYGVFAIVLTGLVVLLIALTGVSPAAVIAARALNTVAGGAIALIAYAVWPTWERTRLPDALARMLDAYREYVDAVRDAYIHPEISLAAKLDRVRLAARLARSNLEASVARFRGEPGMAFDRVTLLDGILANAHRFAHAVMSLEAGLARSRPVPAREPFHAFAAAVMRTLSLVVAALHGSSVAPSDLPDLRQAHTALLHSGDASVDRYALVNLETDRMANSLNTLTEEILRWMGKS